MSFFLDDENVQKIITADELEEMTAASGKSDLEAALPSHIKDLLQKLNMKSTYEEIESSYNNMCFSRSTHPEENWLVESILHYIELFYDSTSARTFASESTLFDEMYSFVKTSKKINNTITEFTARSNASSESKNNSRSIGSTSKIDRQAVGDIPDLSFIYSRI
ncbi:hypothetical protein G6F37_010662 [Rhizopus arrhizus]|nr:hypothetical protein G6F38_006818 [Rhizopus arrhizus]KAG1153098.1 hypothetical protein G6F37_010662 [Rhizopus arrhizus]